MVNTPYRIIVPLDGSAGAEAMLPTIMPLARQGSVHLTLFSAVPAEGSRKAAEEVLARARASLLRQGVEAETKVDVGEPARTIAFHAAPSERDLIAMSTHGRTGLPRVLMGSVASGVLRGVNVPVLAARPGARMDGWTQIVVGLDGSARALEVLEPAVRLASVLGATIHLLGVEDAGIPLVPEPGGGSSVDYLRGIASRLREQGVSASTSVREGLPARELVRYAEWIRAGLLALATHGRTGMGSLLLGSVGAEVLRRAPCPVLLVRSGSRSGLRGAALAASGKETPAGVLREPPAGERDLAEPADSFGTFRTSADHQ